jgi:hypothetical protein
VPRPFSRSALERLGRRIVEANGPSPADVAQLQDLLTAYGPVLAAAVDSVSAAVGSVPSSRVKTTSTIVDKLRRNGGHTLSSIHDLGGMRLVVAGGRAGQDQVAAQIRAAFADGPRAPGIIDRRLEPAHGTVQVVDQMLQLAEQIAEAEESGGSLPMSAVVLTLANVVVHWLQTRQPEP